MAESMHRVQEILQGNRRVADMMRRLEDSMKTSRLRMQQFDQHLERFQHLVRTSQQDLESQFRMIKETRRQYLHVLGSLTADLATLADAMRKEDIRTSRGCQVLESCEQAKAVITAQIQGSTENLIVAASWLRDIETLVEAHQQTLQNVEKTIAMSKNGLNTATIWEVEVPETTV